MPRRSPFTSVTCALFIATSVPVPIAMPTSACASAGASLMPSPAIATTRPSLLQRLDERELVGRLHFAVHLVDAERRGDRARGGECRRRSPSRRACRRARSAASASRRARLDRVRHREQAREPAVDGQVHHARALGAQRLGLRVAAASSATPTCVHQRRVAERELARRRRVRARRCPRRTRSARACRARARARARRARSRRPADARCPGRGSRPAAAPRRRSTPATGTARSNAGLPSVSVPVLSTISVSTSRSVLDRRGVAEQHALRRAPRPVATMIDIGVARPSAHGQAMISTATALTSAVDPARLGAEQAPDEEASAARWRPRRARTSRRRGRPGAASAPASAAPARPSARSARAPSASRRARSASTSAPVVLSVAPISLSPGRLSTGSGSPVSIDSSTALAAFDHDAVDRHLLAGPHAQPVADVDVGERDVLLAAVGARCGARSSARGRAAHLIAAEVCERALQLEHLARAASAR